MKQKNESLYRANTESVDEAISELLAIIIVDTALIVFLALCGFAWGELTGQRELPTWLVWPLVFLGVHIGTKLKKRP